MLNEKCSADEFFSCGKMENAARSPFIIEEKLRLFVMAARSNYSINHGTWWKQHTAPYRGSVSASDAAIPGFRAAHRDRTARRRQFRRMVTVPMPRCGSVGPVVDGTDNLPLKDGRQVEPLALDGNCLSDFDQLEFGVEFKRRDGTLIDVIYVPSHSHRGEQVFHRVASVALALAVRHTRIIKSGWLAHHL